MIALWLASVLARAAQAVRFGRFLLPCFILFTVAAVAEESVYLWRVTHGQRFGSLQQSIAPWLAGLRILAAAEAFWWLATSLPKFRRPAFGLMALCAALSWWLSRSAGGSGIQHVEIATAFGLISFLGLTMLVHSAIGTEAKSALWHAGLFGLAALANGGGWLFQSSRSVGMWVMFGGQIAAAALWLWKVRTPPTWREPEPTVTPEEAREAIEDLRKAAGR